MRSMKARAARLATMVAVLAAGLAVLAPVASAKVAVSFERLDGYASPGTPAKYNKVGILKIGSPRAKNVLVLNPGTSASAAYFAPLATDIVTRGRDWQVWAVERRENLLEDHSVLDKAKAGQGDGRSRPSTTTSATSPNPSDHRPLPVHPGLDRGVREAVGHEHRDRGPPPRREAGEEGRRQRRRGRPLARRLDHHRVRDLGLQAAGPAPRACPASSSSTAAAARRRSARDRRERVARRAARPARRPWLTFGGIPAPFTGLFNTSGALGAILVAERAVARPGLPAAARRT